VFGVDGGFGAQGEGSMRAALSARLCRRRRGGEAAVGDGARNGDRTTRRTASTVTTGDINGVVEVDP
jgi:hypothetical protein